jgi:hypothetical protein
MRVKSFAHCKQMNQPIIETDENRHRKKILWLAQLSIRFRTIM